MKQLKASVFTDSDYPHHLFVRFANGRIACARLLARTLHKDRGIWHYTLLKKSGVRSVISEARIECAIESHREIADIRYISKNKTYRAKKNALLLGLIRAKKELTEENPRIDIDKYIDDAYIRILENGFIPSDYTDLKNFILKNILAVKIEKERKNIPFDDVDYFLSDDKEEENENQENNEKQD